MAKYCGKDFLIQLGYLSGGNWVASTAYTLGQIRVNGSNVYRVTVAGTSAGSGGPTGTGSAIVDGTVTWSYISASVVLASGTFGFGTIGGMRSNSMTINNEQVDVTDKGDVPWRQLLGCGIKSMSMSGSGVFNDDFDLTQVMAFAVGTMAQSIQTFRLVSGRGDSFAGEYQIATLERSGEYNQSEMYSLSLESAGAITYTAAP